MARNKVQFQKGLSEAGFETIYGTEEKWSAQWARTNLSAGSGAPSRRQIDDTRNCYPPKVIDWFPAARRRSSVAAKTRPMRPRPCFLSGSRTGMPSTRHYGAVATRLAAASMV
jgi:hypothetical protein